VSTDYEEVEKKLESGGDIHRHFWSATQGAVRYIRVEKAADEAHAWWARGGGGREEGEDGGVCVGGGRWQTDAVQRTLRTVETDSEHRKKKVEEVDGKTQTQSRAVENNSL